MAKLFNLAQMTTATAGTGTITLGSAVAPFITFAAAGVQNNDVVAYSIIDGANSEMGYGTYSAAGPTLTRNLRKSSTGALLNLSGSAIVRLTPGREDIVNSDGSIAFVANLDMGSNKIINVTDPSNAQDAATKNYVDIATAGITGSHNPVTLGIANGLVLSNQVLSLDLASSTTTGSLSAADWATFNGKQASLGFTPENVANKSTNGLLTGSSDVLYPTEKAVKTYVDTSVAGITGSHSPVTLGTANGLSLSGQQLSLGLSSGTSTGALSGSDWQLFFNKQSSLGFTPENVANKTQLVRSSGTSSTLYPSESAVSSFVSTAISSIPSASGNIGSFLLSGGGVTWVTGYQFRVSAAQYYIQGVLYSSAEQLITLASSDATYDRIDVIVVNTSGQVDKVTGVANASPSEPDIDPATQLQLAFIIVYAASSSPIIQSQTIYSEDAGSPTEWNWSSTGSTWNLASTNNPFAGTKDIEATSLGANAYAQGMATGTVNLGIYTQLNFYVRSKATWNAGRGLYVAWYSNGVRKGNNVFLAHGFFNFNSDNTTDYQLISIPISQFAIPNGTTVNQLRFTRVGGAIGFYLDEIIVTDSGLTATPVGLTQEQADARYVLKRDFATWFNVKDYGAVGNGVTDDTVAINSTIGALNTATRGVLYFPAGSYKCTTGLAPITAAAIIRGDGMNDIYSGARTGSEIYLTSGTSTLFTTNTATAKFEELSLRCSAGTVTAGAGILVGNANGSVKVDFESIHVQGFWIDIDVQYGSQWTMHNCVLMGPVKYALKCQNIASVDSGDWAISDTQFMAKGHNADAALRYESGGGGKITNCKVNDYGPDGNKFVNGIDLTTTAQSGITLIANSSIENVSGDAIHAVVSGGGVWHSVSIIGCEFGLWSNNSGYAINITNISRVIITDCVFQGGTGPYAILLTSVNNARIAENILWGGSFASYLSLVGCTDVYESTGIVPGTYTDNAIVRVDGVTGRTIQNSGITIPDGASGILSGTNTGDQNLFQSIAVSGQSTIFANTPTKALTFAGTGGIVVTTATGTATVTFDASSITGTTNTQILVSGLPIYDDSVFKITGTAISFDNNLVVNVTGTVAYISSSGGGTGSVSVATDPIWDAKGDLAVGTGADTAARLIVGANDTHLVADSAQSVGLKWQGPIGARVFNSTSIGLGTAANTTLTFDSETYDTDNIHSTTGSTSRLTATTAGYYLIIGNVRFTTGNNTQVALGILVDGGADPIAFVTTGGVLSGGPTTKLEVMTIYYLAATHYVELFAYSESASISAVALANYSPYFMMHKLG